MSKPTPDIQGNGNPVAFSHNQDTLGLILMFIVVIILLALLWRQLATENPHP